jgi:hypothetical protein
MKNGLIRMMNVDEWTLICMSFFGGICAGVIITVIMIEVLF